MQKFLSFFYNIRIEEKITVGELGTLIVLAVTLIIGFGYALYTYKLWKESNFQSILSISPYIIFKINEDDILFVKNIGNSMAFNVTIDPLTYILKEASKKREIFILEFEEINLIETNEEIELNYKTTRPDGSIKGDFDLVHHLNPKYQDYYNFLFTIKYTNIIGKKYFTKFYAGKDGIKIKKIGRTTLFNYMLQIIDNVIYKIRTVVKI